MILTSSASKARTGKKVEGVALERFHLPHVVINLWILCYPCDATFMKTKDIERILGSKGSLYGFQNGADGMRHTQPNVYLEMCMCTQLKLSSMFVSAICDIKITSFVVQSF